MQSLGGYLSITYQFYQKKQNGGIKESSHLMGCWIDALTCFICLNHVSPFMILCQGSSFHGIESSSRRTTPYSAQTSPPIPPTTHTQTHIVASPPSPHLVIKSSSGRGNIHILKDAEGDTYTCPHISLQAVRAGSSVG